MHIAFPQGAAEDEDNEDLARINAVLDQARHWHQAETAAAQGDAAAPKRNDQLEALGPMLDGRVPLMLHANRYDVMNAALDWAEEQAFENLVLVATPDVQHIASRLAEANIPVILKNVYALPMRRHDGYDASFVAPKILAEAGVKFAIADATRGMDVANARNLPFQAGSAVAHGLDPDTAVKAVTLWPAEILGVGDALGSLAPGKRATLFAANGHPLEPMTQITHVWIDGQAYDLGEVKGRRLYERYRQRHQASQ
jgi:imidazolonepropionase-like amidohydrolase